MPTPTLDRHDRAVLARLGDGPQSPEALARTVDRPPAELGRRLEALASGGLVRRREDGAYERTESGRRVLAASPAGSADDRIDTSPRVERALDAFDLRPDEADAVRSAYALLRFWGSATPGEIVDATFDEAPAGYDGAGEWWSDCVRDRLAALPGIEPADDDGPWRYVGDPVAPRAAGDGRRVLGRADRPVDASARHALAGRGLSEAERRAVGVALGALRARGLATTATLRRRLERAGDRAAGPGEEEHAGWSDRVREALEAVPGVTRPDGRTWQYRSPAGPDRRRDDEF